MGFITVRFRFTERFLTFLRILLQKQKNRTHVTIENEKKEKMSTSHVIYHHTISIYGKIFNLFKI